MVMIWRNILVSLSSSVCTMIMFWFRVWFEFWIPVKCFVELKERLDVSDEIRIGNLKKIIHF